MRSIATIVRDKRAFRSLYNSIKEAICRHSQAGLTEYTMFFDFSDPVYVKVLERIRAEGYSTTVGSKIPILTISWAGKDNQ